MWGYKWPIIYLASATKLKVKLDLHKALLFLGDAFIANKVENSAANLYQVALAGFTQMDVHCSRAQCMLRLGDLASKHGCTSEAITFWEAAQPLFERASQTKDVAKIDSRLATWEKDHHKALVKLETLHAPIQLGKEETLEIKGEDSIEDTEEHTVHITLVSPQGTRLAKGFDVFSRMQQSARKKNSRKGCTRASPSTILHTVAKKTQKTAKEKQSAKTTAPTKVKKNAVVSIYRMDVRTSSGLHIVAR
ncbi:hypothetical protein K438DRAFT_1791146 [Mycena galopus ATCC 62051]|nr:hypothetical protein K438DRAFT_1791146 [Mycena galopus ATCC 62051]